MNEFTASNGAKVELANAGKTGYVLAAEGVEALAYLGFEEMKAWREFVIAERDEQLGRWRSKEHPEYIVKPSDQFEEGVAGSWVRVLHEPTTFVEEFARHALGGATRDNMQFVEVAREFFKAHPEPQPWHSAKPGEVWERREGFSKPPKGRRRTLWTLT